MRPGGFYRPKLSQLDGSVILFPKLLLACARKKLKNAYRSYNSVGYLCKIFNSLSNPLDVWSGSEGIRRNFLFCSPRQVPCWFGSPAWFLTLYLMKVPFEEVPELVATRRVFIQKGHAYVAMNQVNFNAYCLMDTLKPCGTRLHLSDWCFIVLFS